VQVANSLKISRSPVREALKKLEAEGLVNSFNGRGSFALQITQQDLEEIFDLRLIFELASLKRASKNIDREFWSEIEKSVESLGDTSSPLAFYEVDHALHHTIIKCGGNSRLEGYYHRLENQIDIVRRISAQSPTHFSTSSQYHLKIIHAMQDNKLDQAAIHLEDHIIDVKNACIEPQIMSITPISGTKLVGGNFTLTVSATGSGPLKYQWKKDGTNLTDDPSNHIAGAKLATLVMSGIGTNDTGEYTCEVSNEGIGDCTEGGKTVMGIAGTVMVLEPQAGNLDNGKFISGETCFDVNTGANSNTECGATANRTTMNLAGIYTYTFQHVTANGSLQFMLEDALNAVELIGFSTFSGDFLSPIPAGDPAVALSAINAALGAKTSFTAGSAYSITLKFKNTLNQQGQNPSAYGTTDNNPVMVKLSALYGVNSSTYMESLVISIKDCFCCGMGGVAVPFKAASGNTYLTHKYPTGANGAAQCWMVSNSKEGTPTSTHFGGDNTREDRGYYYSWTLGHNESNVCPNGWKLPEVAEADRLSTYVRLSSGSLTPNDLRKWWYGPTLIAAHAAGSRQSGVNQSWIRWDDNVSIFVNPSSQYSFSRYNESVVEGILQGYSQASVRCVWSY
jgi:uncharacterized protein (TIGR02145 family)